MPLFREAPGFSRGEYVTSRLVSVLSSMKAALPRSASSVMLTSPRIRPTTRIPRGACGFNDDRLTLGYNGGRAPAGGAGPECLMAVMALAASS